MVTFKDITDQENRSLLQKGAQLSDFSFKSWNNEYETTYS